MVLFINTYLQPNFHIFFHECYRLFLIDHRSNLQNTKMYPSLKSTVIPVIKWCNQNCKWSFSYLLESEILAQKLNCKFPPKCTPKSMKTNYHKNKAISQQVLTRFCTCPNTIDTIYFYKVTRFLSVLTFFSMASHFCLAALAEKSLLRLLVDERPEYKQKLRCYFKVVSEQILDVDAKFF